MRLTRLLGILVFTAHPVLAQSSSADALAARLPALMDSGGIPGLSITVIRSGNIAFARGFGVRGGNDSGRVDPNTVFEAASLSKPVVAYIALKLVDLGMLDLDRPITNYIAIPDLNDPRVNRITTRMILSHTTGLQNERHGDEPLTLAFNPGEQFRYSGEGFLLLQRVVESVSGESLEALAQRLVFKPLGMTRSAFVWKPAFAANAAIGYGDFRTERAPTRPATARAPSSLHTTAHDYALFVRAIMNRQGLEHATFAEMTKPQVTAAPGIAWGLGWAIETSSSSPMLWHWGDNSNSGFKSFVMIDPSRKDAVLYFANSNSGLSIVRPIAELLKGPHAAPDFMGYETYNAPSRSVRLAIEEAVRLRGAAAGLSVYDSLRKQIDSTAFPENLLNNLGYRFLSLNRPGDAVALFRRNVELFPQSSNAYDSLGDGFQAIGNNDAAIASYLKSYALDNRNEHAMQQINRLRGKS